MYYGYMFNQLLKRSFKMKTIKSINLGFNTISLKQSNDLADSYVTIVDNVNPATILLFDDEIDQVINALQIIKESIKK